MSLLGSSAWAGDRRIALGALGVAVAINLALALPRLGDAPFGFNEAATALVVDGPLSSLHSRAFDAETNGPAYFYVLYPWAYAFGSEPWSLRTFSVAAGVGVLLMLFRLGAAHASPGVGAAAALLAASWPYLIWLEHYARWYAFTMLLAVVSTLLFLRMCRLRSTASAVAYGLVGGLMGWSFTPAYAVPAAHLAAGAVWRPGDSDRPWRVLAVSAATVGAFGIAELPLLLDQFQTLSGFWTPRQGWLGMLRALAVLYGSSEASLALLSCALLGAVLGFVRPRFRQERFVTFVCLLWACSLPAALVLRSALGSPSIVTRYASPSMPALIFLAASLLARLPGAGSLLGFAAALAAGLLWLPAEHQTIEREVNLGRTQREIHRRVGPGEALLYTDQFLFLPARRLHRDAIASYLWAPGISEKGHRVIGLGMALDDPAALAEFERVWIVHRRTSDLPDWVPRPRRTHRVPPSGLFVTEYRPLGPDR
ncbi:MAG: hypothetical protein JSU66_17055 [Deltaproteobacteria bacterium]|nr:MAG: hypothetical protein JSU66_17055 [Deltaproteobacteria bacterium]